MTDRTPPNDALQSGAPRPTGSGFPRSLRSLGAAERGVIAGLLLAFSAVAAADDKSNTQTKAGGTMYFIFDMASETTIDGVLFARFVPDAESLKNFPAVTTGKHPGAVKYISFEPAEEILEATFGRTEAHRVSHGAMPREIEVPVEVVVTDYKPEVECDSRAYYAKLVSVKVTGKHVASLNNVPQGC